MEKISTKKSWRYMVATALALSLAAKANATINAVATLIPVDATLTANGWIGIQISLVATDPGETILDFDFANPAIASSVGVTGTIGISGPIEQRGITKKGTGTYVSTAQGDIGVEADISDPTTTQDSYWYSPDPAYSAIPNLSEDTNHANLSAGQNNSTFGYTASPETDIPFNSTANGVDYGVGSVMTMAAGFVTATAPSSIDIAFVITPTYQTGLTLEQGFTSGIPVFLRGVAEDNSQTLFPINFIINTDNVPEPASLGIFVVGSVGLLLRRKAGIN